MPRYGTATIAELVPAATAAVTGGTDRFGLGSARAVVLLVVDGLGAEQLRAHAADAPCLVAASGTVLDATFPTTTVTSLGSIGVGAAPGRHGLVGYAIGLAGHDQPFNLLRWRIGRRAGGADARTRVRPEDFQPLPTTFERAGARGVRVTTVLASDVVDSGLTRAALRGARRVTADGLTSTLRVAVAAAAPGPALVYAHHPTLDTIGHAEGTGTPRWRAELRRIDASVARVSATLPGGTVLAVTADHGMRSIADADVVETHTDDLEDGVDVVVGDPRVRGLVTRPGAAEDVAAAWRETVGTSADVIGRDEAVAAGWFGPTLPRVLPRIPDLLVVPWSGLLANARTDPKGGRFRGMHGALTAAEVHVPLRLLRRRRH